MVDEDEREREMLAEALREADLEGLLEREALGLGATEGVMLRVRV